MKLLTTLLLLSALAAADLRPVYAQERAPRSSKKALALSLLLPGLGQRYVQHGSWRGSATAYLLVDAAALLGLVGAETYRAGLVNDYRTLAAARAGAQIEGKERSFFLNLATYPSSDAYRDTQLRNRNWNEVDYVADPAFQWAWQDDDSFVRFRTLREDAESLRRRGSFLIGVMVANRIVSGVTAIRAAGRTNTLDDATLTFTPPPRDGRLPVLHVRVRF